MQEKADKRHHACGIGILDWHGRPGMRALLRCANRNGGSGLRMILSETRLTAASGTMQNSTWNQFC